PVIPLTSRPISNHHWLFSCSRDYSQSSPSSRTSASLPPPRTGRPLWGSRYRVLAYAVTPSVAASNAFMRIPTRKCQFEPHHSASGFDRSSGRSISERRTATWLPSSSLMIAFLANGLLSYGPENLIL